MRKHAISDAEWIVLQAVWGDQPASADEVMKRLEGRTDWHARTVKTMLHRLVRKGILAFKRDGKRYLYSPRVAREACVRQASRSFLDRVFGGAAAPALLHLAEEADLSRADVERLKSILNRKLDRKGRAD